METIRSVHPNANGAAATAAHPAPSRVPALPPEKRVKPANPASRAQTAPAPLKRSLAAWDNRLQDDVARAQQALDYLESLESQLESIKGDFAARLSGARGARQTEAQVRQLGSALAARRKSGGNGVDAELGFSGSRPAAQRFRIRGLDIGAIKAAGTRSLAFTVAGGPQVGVSIDPDMSGAEIARSFDRALSPLNLHASLDDQGQLVFTAPESDWSAIKDSIVLVGAGRVTTEEIGGSIDPQGWDTGNVDALRQSLREVVQALARVRHSQAAARAALSVAMARAASDHVPPPKEVQQMAQSFASTASSPDYGSLIAITSALVGVNRERVQALLGLR
jgi:hypothetical protein